MHRASSSRELQRLKQPQGPRICVHCRSSS
jgi:hypothetical protein